MENFLPLELNIDQLPKRMVLGDRHFAFAYHPILSGQELSAMLIVISDITSEVARERFESEQREIIHVLERMMNDRLGFLEFLAESHSIVDQVQRAEDHGVLAVKRHLHTLKGNAGIFGLTTIAAACHNLEAKVVETRSLPSKDDRRALHDLWSGFSTKLDTLLGDQSRVTIELGDDEYHAVLSAALRGAPKDELVRMIESWKLEPTAKRLDRISEQAKSIAQRLQKAPLEVRTHAHGLRLPRERWAPFWSAFIHVVRNAVDHGIEEKDERLALGKKPQGILDVSTQLEDGELVIRLSDDGRGIDWARVKACAEGKGLQSRTEKDLVNALLTDGFTTRDSATEFSGRGIGLGAVQRASEERGGQILVSSKPGEGTTIEFRFPIQAMADCDLLSPIGTAASAGAAA
jgi:two-component system chemotaxis sensor kinase CheA